MDRLRMKVRDLLEKWLRGEVGEHEVMEEAERLIDTLGWPEFPEGDDRSIAMEVLSQLEILGHQLITKQDIPAMLHFLSADTGHSLEAWSQWREYWNGVDFSERRQKLKGNPFYSQLRLEDE